MKRIICIFIVMVFIRDCMANEINNEQKEALRVAFIKKLSNKGWYKLSAIEIKNKMLPTCTQDNKYKLVLNCDSELGVKKFNIIGEYAYEPLTQIVFNDAVGCLSMIKALQEELGKPSEISVGKCDATWNLGRNSKYKKTRVFASIFAPPSGKHMEFSIGSEQGDD